MFGWHQALAEVASLIMTTLAAPRIAHTTTCMQHTCNCLQCPIPAALSSHACPARLYSALLRQISAPCIALEHRLVKSNKPCCFYNPDG
jgi:hypothetical protein